MDHLKRSPLIFQRKVTALRNEQHWDSNSWWTVTALNRTGTASPLDSISLIHMSTTIGRLVMWAFTSVVRSQLYTFLTCFKSGLQSLGTILEHCLWTFKPQSERKKMRYCFKSSEHSGLFILAKDTLAWMRFKRGWASRSSCRVGKHFSYLFSWKILVLSQKTKLLAHVSSLTCYMILGYTNPNQAKQEKCLIKCLQNVILCQLANWNFIHLFKVT